MKLTQMFWLANRNFVQHKRRSLLLVLGLAVWFALVLTMWLWLTGFERSYQHFASLATGGKVVVQASNGLGLTTGSSTSGTATAGSDAVTADSGTKVADLDAMVADLEQFGARIISTQADATSSEVVLPPEVVAGAIEVDPSQAPATAAPVLVTVSQGRNWLGQDSDPWPATAAGKREYYEQLREALIGHTFTSENGAEYFVVGLAPGDAGIGNFSFNQLAIDNFNVLNPLLEGIAAPSAATLLLDNGQMATWERGESRDLAAEIEYLENLGIDVGDVSFTMDTVVAEFADVTAAQVYLWGGQGQFARVSDDRAYTYSANVVAGPSPETGVQFASWRLVALGITVLAVVLAVVLVLLMGARQVSQDQAKIQRYLRLGATPGQVRAVYSLYFLELMLLVLALAWLLASGVVLGFSAINQELLSTQALLAFSLPEAPTVIWYGVGTPTVVVSGLVILQAPLLILLSWRKFYLK